MQQFICVCVFFLSLNRARPLLVPESLWPRVWHSDIAPLFMGLSTREVPHFLSIYISQINSSFISLSWMPPSVRLLMSPMILFFFIYFITDFFFFSAAAFSLKCLLAFRYEGRKGLIKGSLLLRYCTMEKNQLPAKMNNQWSYIRKGTNFSRNEVNISDNWIMPAYSPGPHLGFWDQRKRIHKA